MSIKGITKSRFDAFAAYSRHPRAVLMSEEVAWLAAEASQVCSLEPRAATR